MQAVAVDLALGDHAHLDPLRTAEHALEELLALLGRALLRVVEKPERAHPVIAQASVVQQDAGDDERPGKRPAPGLVRPRDEPRTEPPVELEELLANPAHERRG
jgi:hypothetical protein